MFSDISVVIGIATCRRTAQLRRLLRSLEQLTFRNVTEPAITLLVVDNDPSASAKPAVCEFLSRRFRIRYVHEVRQGLAYARNALVANARSCDFLAMVDDDEEVSPQWLDSLLATQAMYRASIVAGPVISRFSCPSALEPFFLRKRHATGTTLISAGAGNVLVSQGVLRDPSLMWFDPRFNRSGGEDTHFFRRCIDRGYEIVWADEAVAWEEVDPSRCTPSYLIARARNGANHWTRVELELRSNPLYLVRRFGVGVIRATQGAALQFVAALTPAGTQMKGRLLLAEGLGNLHAFFGGRYHVYGGPS